MDLDDQTDDSFLGIVKRLAVILVAGVVLYGAPIGLFILIGKTAQHLGYIQ